MASCSAPDAKSSTGARMSTDAYISCRVPADFKARLRERAVREGATESELIKRLLGPALPGQPLPPMTQSSPPDAARGTRTWRLSVRLAASDRRLLRERAAARGLSPSTYAALQLGVHLRGGNPLPRAEYLVLRQAVLELRSIGQDLNKATFILQKDNRASVPGRSEVQMMLKIATGLKDHFKALLSANERAWR
jgi:hypothetical protein